MTTLNREQILAQRGKPKKTSKVEVPEWGEDAVVIVRGLSARERFEWALNRNRANSGGEEAEGAFEPQSHLVALSVVDDNGVRIFSDQDAEFIEALDSATIERITDDALILSGLIEGSVADAEGNSGPTPSSGTPSDLPPSSDAPTPS